MLRQQLRDGVSVRGELRNQHNRRNRIRVRLRIQRHDRALDVFGKTSISDVGVTPLDHRAVGDPATLTSNAAVTDREDLDCHLDPVVVESEDIGVSAVSEHDSLLLQHAVQRGEVVAVLRRLFIPLTPRRISHSALEITGEPSRIARHECQEVVDDLPVLIDADPTHTGRSAFPDVTQQAWPARRVGALVDTGAA
jgi:hypothetical protein